jgi:lysyl-tRNA synthetase class 1
MKTPSGKIHVGSLRGIVVHDLVYKALLDRRVKAKYTYVFDNHDPMDALPLYLPKDYVKYLGMPLYKIPSPVEGFSNFAEHYAKDFISTFNAISCEPEILWSTDLYESGKMNASIKRVLDKTIEVRKIYEELYEKKLPQDWYPFQPYCPKCGKVSTTRAISWDGKEIAFVCDKKLDWTDSCGFKGKMSPLSKKGYIPGKLPWKIEWAVKWKVIGVTIEGAGKDHMSSGGSHDLASLICERILKYPVPFPVGYEFFLIGGRKMSSSKGLGTSASEMLEILPPEILRFLMVRTRLNQAINFDPSDKDTIPSIFDDYQRAATAYFEKQNADLARIFELSQIGKVRRPPSTRFSMLTQWVQMPNMTARIKEEGLLEWAKYAKVWVERFAPESEKFTVSSILPEAATLLSSNQKQFLLDISIILKKDWEALSFQEKIYQTAKEQGLTSTEAFEAIYKTLIGKAHGPKAAWLILSLERDFVRQRFEEAAR